MAKVKFDQAKARKTHIRAWRKYRGLSLEEVAAEIDVTAGALSQLERGSVAYTQAMLEELARVFQCEPADLIAWPPGENEDLRAIWAAIPEGDRAQALKVLKAFAKKP